MRYILFLLAVPLFGQVQASLFTGTLGSVGSAVGTPTSSPGSGTYTSSQAATVHVSTSGATICTTIDGTTPTANGAGTCTHGATHADGDALTAFTATTVLKMIGSKSGLSDSGIASNPYTIQVAQPVDSNSGGGCTGSSPSWTCSGASTITLTDATSAAVICYRTDGNPITVVTPGTCPAGSTTYSAPFTSPSTSFTLISVGTKSGLLDSSQLSSVYTIGGTGGTFSFDQGVASDDGFTSGTTWTTCGASGCTTGINIASGKTVLVTAAFYAGCGSTTATITDSQGGNTYTQVTSGMEGAGGNLCMGSWIAKNITGDTNMIWTVTFSSGVIFRSISVMSLTASAPSAVAVDQTLSTLFADTPGIPTTTGAFTTTSTNGIVIVTGFDGRTFSAVNNFDSVTLTVPAGCQSTSSGVLSLGYHIVSSVQTADTISFTSGFSGQPYIFKVITLKD